MFQEEPAKVWGSRNKSPILTAPFARTTNPPEPQPQPSRQTKSNKSQFQNGLTLDLEVRLSKNFGNSTNNKSQIRFEPLSRQEKADYSSQFRPRSRSPYSQSSRDIRNPILGENAASIDASSMVPGKKIIEFKPSKQLDNHNKKKYMMITEMKPLSELYSQQAEIIHNRNKSSIPISNPNPREPEADNVSQRSRTPTKRTYTQQGHQMGSILMYKDALPYREEGYIVSTKINQTSNQAVVKHTLEQQINLRKAGNTRMTKSKELKSDIGF